LVLGIVDAIISAIGERVARRAGIHELIG
jgi:hypothetical protein